MDVLPRATRLAQRRHASSFAGRTVAQVASVALLVARSSAGPVIVALRVVVRPGGQAAVREVAELRGLSGGERRR